MSNEQRQKPLIDRETVTVEHIGSPNENNVPVGTSTVLWETLDSLNGKKADEDEFGYIKIEGRNGLYRYNDRTGKVEEQWIL